MISHKFYQRTFVDKENFNKYGWEVTPGVYSSVDPFQSETFVWLKKMEGRV